MSTLQCANIHFESTQNNRVQYFGTNTVAVVAGGTNNFVGNATTSTVVTGTATGLTTNSTITRVQVNSANSLVANTTATSLTVGAAVGFVTNGSSVTQVQVNSANSLVANTTTTTLTVGAAAGLTTNSTVTRVQVNSVNSVVANTTTTALTVGATVMLTANTTAVNVATNGFNLGSFSNAAAGYTILPNRMKMNWGTAVTNSIGANLVTFSSAFTTNTYGLSLTVLGASTNAGAANVKTAYVTTVNSSAITIYTGNNSLGTNAGATAVYYMAIGPA